MSKQPACTMQIAVYRQGQLRNELVPKWWDVVDLNAAEGRITLFDVDASGDVSSVEAPEGHIVLLTGTDNVVVTTIWCPTAADHVDFLCGHAARFAKVLALRHLTYEVNRLGSAHIAAARHAGVSISRLTGELIQDQVTDHRKL